MTTTHPERLAYGIREAAEALGVSDRHVRTLIARGVVREVRLGGRRLIPADALHELLNGEGAQ